MELKEFIKQSIIEISEAVQEANEYFEDKKIDAYINPKNIDFPHNSEKPSIKSKDLREDRLIEEIAFDIAVTTSGEISAGAKAGIKIASIEIGGKGEVVDKQQNVSRLKFTIPVCLPAEEYKY